MLLRSARLVSRLLLLVMVWSWLPQAAIAAPLPAEPTPPVGGALGSPPAAAPVPIVTQPIPKQLPPGLAIELSVAPDPLAIGETATISVTITNRSPYPAEALDVSVPTPDGALALPGPSMLGPQQGWRWTTRLEGNRSTTLTGQLQLVRNPNGDALLLTAQASAMGLTTPVQATGGALVVDRTRDAAMASFTPGTGALLRSPDGRVTVQFPARAANRALLLRYGRTPLAGQVRPTDRGRSQEGLGTFFLDATDTLSATVHQFDQPLTISVSYTPEQLQAHGLREADLTLWWFDTDEQRWRPLTTQVDTATHTASASVDHFTPFQLSDGLSASTAYIPSLQGFQTDLFTGAASYRIPVETPAGPNGLKPDVALTYSSAATDGSGGVRDKAQSGWAGKGWSVSAEGSVSRAESLEGSNWDYFTFVFGGRSFDVVRGPLLDGFTDPNDTDLTHWSWRSVDENYTRIRLYWDGAGYVWQAFTKDGTRYDFTQRLWHQPEPGSSSTYRVYKWLLTQVTDTHGNLIIYDYQVDSVLADSGTGATVNPTYRLREIRWAYDGALTTDGFGAQVRTGSPRYKVVFVPSTDTQGTPTRWIADSFGDTTGVDTDYEYPFKPNGYWSQVSIHEAYRLNQIQVYSRQASTWELVRGLNLLYASATNSLTSDTANGQKTLTLSSVQRIGKDGSGLPATSFSYGMSIGDPQNTTPGWNRLTSVNNGQGGKLSFTYEHVFLQNQLPSGENYARDYANYYRVKEALAEDLSGTGKSALTTYSYTGQQVNDEAHSASVFYAHYPASLNGDSRTFLAHPEKREFRGHATVIERHYDGGAITTPLLQEVQHWFYQGTATCNLSTILLMSGSTQYVDENNSCFQTMVQHEGWKGKEFQTEVRAGSTVLQRTTHTFSRVSLPYYGSDTSTAGPSNHYKRAGLWRAFNPLVQTLVQAFEGGGTSLDKKTTYAYDQAGYQSGGVFGNLTSMAEYDGTTLIRSIDHYYNTINTVTSYIVDRPWIDVTRDSIGRILSLTDYFYDGHNTTPNVVGVRGDLTRVAKYYDVPLTSNLVNVTLHGQDTTYTYDSYGNRLTETTYAQAGSRLFNGSTWTISAPGSGSAARSSTTAYDTIFHALPTNFSNALSHAETAGYDYRMGTLTSVQDANGATTNASYDAFGRMVALVKPGDTSTYPTVQASYYDSEQPFRYLVAQREQAGTVNTRFTQTFYDGLGRQIQQKKEGPGGWQNIVVDTRYDGLNRVVQQSQPRESNENGTTFWQYTSPGAGSLYNQTTTSYDALGRVSTTTTPDGATTAHFYLIWNDGGVQRLAHNIVDANRHRTKLSSDALGRQVKVEEISGDCGQWSYSCGGAYTSTWATYATTSYTYSPLDLLMGVSDAKGNATSISYDTLGRKTAMSDPDMGSWGYTYHVNGTLATQLDAKGQTTTFYYDSLDRLTDKTYSDGTQQAIYRYDESSSTNGIGRRTSQCRWNGSACTSWEGLYYDARGRVTTRVQAVAGVQLTLGATYDSADRMVSQTYTEAGETVNYTYDAAWHPYSACGTICYIGSASYTPLSQPDVWTYNSSSTPFTQDWNYSSPMQRLSALTVGPSLFGRSYTYDAVGNVKTIGDTLNAANNQSYNYDERDRLTSWTLGSTPASYSYDQLGNLTSKAGTTYGYTPGSGPRPHAVSTVGGEGYTYDANGNLLSGGGRIYTWTADNLPATVTSGGQLVTDGPWNAQSASVYHQVGRADGDGWSANTAQDSAAYLQYGPYTAASGTGAQVARWNLLIDNNSADNAAVVQLDVHDATTGTVLASRTVTRREWTATWQYQEFALPYTLDSSRAGHALEYRVYWYDAAYVRIQQVRVTRQSGAATESYTYDADGERVAKTVGGVTTVYFQGIWEQIVGGASKRYYTFNGQAVAMRDSATNAVTYLHGDHLGSVSLATNTSGQSVSQQEFDPWGKVRSGGVGATSVNYTGQRLDGTGLLYYHARYYDPALARFVSADSVAPGKQNPQARNRYTYVLNNPLKYTDPTGHCAEGYSTTLAGCEQYLNDHGWSLDLAAWTYNELHTFVVSIYDLKQAGGWSIADYRSTMTDNGAYSLRLERQSANSDDPNRPAQVESPGWFSNQITLTIYDALYKQSPDLQKFNLVHEQAHVWDAATAGGMSEGLKGATGSYNSWWGLGPYVPQGATATEYKTSQYEDWAEVVAAAVYPKGERSWNNITMSPRMGSDRYNHIKAFLPNADIFSGTWTPTTK